MPFRVRIFAGFLAVILALGVVLFFYGSFFISQNVVGRTQRELNQNLKAAWNVYNGEMELLGTVADFIGRLPHDGTPVGRPEVLALRKKYGLDYILFEPAGTPPPGDARAETRVLSREDLAAISPALAERAFIADAPSPTPLAKHGRSGDVTGGLVMEATAWRRDAAGAPAGRVRVGKLLNRNFVLVDRIRDILFETRTHGGTPVGNVTIFLGDRRVTTNVLADDGSRAVGTYLSESVYDKVIGEGVSWRDRAFVVTDWYLTAYDPIRDRAGRIVGVLYVGLLERPFTEMRQRMFLNLALILGLAVVLGGVLSYRISYAITKPVRRMIGAVEAFGRGDFSHRVGSHTSIDELNVLGSAFNAMAQSIHDEREEILVANRKLDAANKNYLNMIGFVSHELKGVLGSIVMNIYSLKDGYLGPLGEKQQRAVDSAARSLDHFETMVKNYLDLSRIEKGELRVNKTPLDLANDVVKPSVAHFEKQAQERKVRLEIDVPAGVRLVGDRSLLLIVMNNLLGNALKYGTPGGRIAVSCAPGEGAVTVGVYNDGRPIGEEHVPLLFQRFSRLPGSETVKGTGLGLFITRQIVEKHGGTIRVEPKPSGNTFVFTLEKGAEHGE